jgi:hypothetical protein
MPLLLGIGDAVPQNFIAALAQLFRNVRTVLVDLGIDLRLDRDIEFVKEFKQAFFY